MKSDVFVNLKVYLHVSPISHKAWRFTKKYVLKIISMLKTRSRLAQLNAKSDPKIGRVNEQLWRFRYLCSVFWSILDVYGRRQNVRLGQRSIARTKKLDRFNSACNCKFSNKTSDANLENLIERVKHPNIFFLPVTSCCYFIRTFQKN